MLNKANKVLFNIDELVWLVEAKIKYKNKKKKKEENETYPPSAFRILFYTYSSIHTFVEKQTPTDIIQYSSTVYL